MPLNGYIFLPPMGHRQIPKALAKMAKYQTLSYEKQADAELKSDSIVINWGNTEITRRFRGRNLRVYNPPEAVKVASNKLLTFRAMKKGNVPIPDFTEDAQEARKWFDAGSIVYSRSILCGHSGNGITLQVPHNGGKFKESDAFKIHTKRFNGKEEYRVHIINGKVVHVQQKKRKNGTASDTDYYIKNHDNGYIFAIQEIECPQHVLDGCLAAMEACDLDIGAVDVAYAPTKKTFCVFEINTRPMLIGTTLTKYTNALKELLNGTN